MEVNDNNTPAPQTHVAGDATLWVSPVDLRAWQREKAGEIFAWSENVEGQCVPLRLVEEPHPAPSSPAAWVADYTKSDGTTDYYVMIGEGERAMSLHMHSIRGRAEYEAAEINHALTGSPKPEFDDFALDTATPSPQPNVEGPQPCDIADPSTRDCPNMKEVGGGFEGERYRCAVCGKGYFLDYEEMK